MTDSQLSPYEIYRILEADKNYFECQLEVITETEKAICFNTYGGFLDKQRSVWIPKSKCQFVEHTDLGRRIFIETWLYKKLK